MNNYNKHIAQYFKYFLILSKIEHLDQQSKVLNSFFIAYQYWGLSKYTDTKVQITCFYLI